MTSSGIEPTTFRSVALVPEPTTLPRAPRVQKDRFKIETCLFFEVVLVFKFMFLRKASVQTDGVGRPDRRTCHSGGHKVALRAAM
jgi:hypothetical protein